MLAFVTSLRHPQNSAEYSKVEMLLEDTLRSVTNQTSSDYIVIVVGNERPKFSLPPKVEFLQVDFPAPAPPTGPRTERGPFIWDKGTKIGAGLAAAREFDPHHVMIFDADDFISRHLVEYVEREAPGRGWYVEDGWMYSRSRGVFKPISNFHQACGTSFIVPFDVYGLPADVTPKSTQVEIADGLGDRLDSIVGAHRGALAWHADRGRLMRPIPFRAAVYHVDTGENHSGKALTGISRYPSTALREEFSVPRTTHHYRAVWNAIGPLAAAETALGKLRAARARRAPSAQ